MKIPQTRKKIVSQRALVTRVKSLKRRKKRIVFTNGCFDILHEGHITYLEKAAKLGDVLIVAIDDDLAIRTQKGTGRPVNALKSRQRVLAALGFIDYVVSFSDSDPAPLIRKLAPDILVKGGDWKVRQIIGSKDVMMSGGKVYSIPLVSGHSTTSIIKRCRK